MTGIRPSSPMLDRLTLRQRLAGAENIALLDVRTPAEFESVHIPGSVNLPLDQLEAHLDELTHGLARPIVLVCRSGNRAVQAERILTEAGVNCVQVLEGGILAWERAGGTVRRGRQRWDLERQVRFVAGSLVLLGVLGSVVYGPMKWIAGAIGAGLTIAALTDSCLMGMLLSKLPYNRGGRCDAGESVSRLRAGARQIQVG